MNRRHFLYRIGMAMAFAASADLAPAGEWLRNLKAELPESLAALPFDASELTNLIHEVYTKSVVAHLHMESEVVRILSGGTTEDYHLAGEKLVFSTDMRYGT
ncbi:MAG: hypothetical protein NUW01_04030 [Gemmatimonadaceae bacterium]|nr:hypothetical protein [Gemmatimonadaceae bacterium]